MLNINYINEKTQFKDLDVGDLFCLTLNGEENAAPQLFLKLPKIINHFTDSVVPDKVNATKIGKGRYTSGFLLHFHDNDEIITPKKIDIQIHCS